MMHGQRNINLKQEGTENMIEVVG